MARIAGAAGPSIDGRGGIAGWGAGTAGAGAYSAMAEPKCGRLQSTHI
jgi:hypothetical protein